MNILIATGIYPPKVGGPSQYAANLKKEWEKTGSEVRVRTFTFEHYLPTGLRHLFYFLKIIPSVFRCDFVFALDTFSVGWPAVCAATILRKKVIIRTGGDFLWEGYVERSKEKVLLRDFYKTTQDKWSYKERLIFRITKWTLRNASAVAFSTQWQKDIWQEPYELDRVKTYIIENYYGEKEVSFEPEDKEFVASTRRLVWKNLDILDGIDAKIFKETLRYEDLMDKIAHSYGVILVSLGDISPNLVLDAIRYSKPFILTTENGLMERVGEIAITVNPKDKNDIQNKVLWLCNKENYDNQVEKIRQFNFTHTWLEIANEIIDIWKKS